ncbi:MAG: hypothetical protein ACM3PF_01965 [Bacteroidota bacterium]
MSPRPAAALLVAALLAPFLLAPSGCARRSDEHAGASIEREEIRGGHRILLKSSVSPRRVTLGDPVVWTLAAELPAAGRPGKLLRSRAAAELDVQPPRAPRSEPSRSPTLAGEPAGRTLWTWPYQVRGFGLGLIALPAVRLPVAFGPQRDTLIFPADTLAVDSLTRAATGTVLPDRGPVTPELRPIDYAVAAGILLVLVIAALLIVRALRRRRERPMEVVPAEPPDETLRRALASLRAEGEPMARDAFYDRLSLAIRDYAAAATGITTRDRTTMEIVRDLRERSEVAPAGIDALRRALARADLAKFARRGGGWDEALDVIGLAERLPETLPARRPPAEETEPHVRAKEG